MRSDPSRPAGASSNSGVTTLCRCWILTRRDGVVHGLHRPRPRSSSSTGTPATPAPGSPHRKRPRGSVLQVDGSEIAGALADDSLDRSRSRGRPLRCRDDRDAISSTGASRRCIVLLAQGRARRGAARGQGLLGGIARSLAHRLNEESGRLYTATCAADLGDARCSDRSRPIRRFAAAARSRRSPAPRRFTPRASAHSPTGGSPAGKLAFTGGANAGFAVEVKTPSRRARRRAARAVAGDAGEPLAPGDAFIVTAGCDKRFATCRDRFANARQLPRLPAHPGQRLRHRVSGAGEGDALTMHSP